MEKYGYIRVSSKDQNPERQLIAMRDMGITEKNLFLDKESGKTFARSAYRKLMKKLRPGDILVVKSIDRLGRNYEEIKTQWARITRDIGADIQVMDLPLLDTTTRQSDLTGVFIADIVLQILAYVAETERTMIRQRQAEGIAAAKRRGVTFGRERKETPAEFDGYCRRWLQNEISIRKAAKELHMSPTTFYRRCREQLAGSNGDRADASCKRNQNRFKG